MNPEELPKELAGYTEDDVARNSFDMKGIWTWPCLLVFFVSLVSPENPWLSEHLWHVLALISGLLLFASFFIAATLTPRNRFTGKPMRSFLEQNRNGAIKYYVCDTSKTYFKRTIMGIQYGKGRAPQ
ncbi:MAG TPA: hypothetical protein VHY22_13205 [Chthoniobacteraceae bacterium]|jgi:hypothetical protein|nr:hypothetical protein [Chthoniobacteraceae bacterium]